MAVTTYTSTTYAAQNSGPKQHIYGASHVSGKFVWSAAGTVGDVVFLCKVPHGAKVVSFEEYHSSGQTAAAIDFGFNKGIAAGGGANASCLISGGAIATMNRMSFAASPNGVPVQISLSDTDPVRYATLTATAASGTFTLTVSLTWAIQYRTDDPLS